MTCSTARRAECSLIWHAEAADGEVFDFPPHTDNITSCIGHRTPSPQLQRLPPQRDRRGNAPSTSWASADQSHHVGLC